MYIPRHFEETDVKVLRSLIRAHPLGTWVTPGDGRLTVNHIPFLLHEDRGALGTLVGHVARANPVWRDYSKSSPSVVIFQGPEAYITPSWYPSKREHGKVVPTWNYAVVHAHGLPRVIESKDWLLGHVSELTRAHESKEAKPWKVADAPSDYIDGLLATIVGIEIPIDALEGKWKAGQNRTPADQAGAIEGLKRRGDEASAAVAEIMSRNPQRKS
jgi:transcriptional regulator